MFNLKCPHDPILLTASTITALQKIEKYIEANSPEEFEKAMQSVSDLSPENFTSECAKHHSISVETLVNSPNYQVLKDDFGKAWLNKIFKNFNETLGFDDKECRSIVMHEQVGIIK